METHAVVRKTLVIYGPTATGKTNLALALAKKFNGELISADSRQVYKGLDIGTGKVSFGSKVEKHHGYWIVDGVKIHGFDLVNPGKNFSVTDFLNNTSASLIQISEAHKLPIIVGGTGFYIKALIDGLETIGIPADKKLRHKLEGLSAVSLYEKLLGVDPQRAKSMNESDSQNPRRLIRAIEIAIHSQKHKTRNQKQTVNGQLSNVNCLLIGLTAPNSYLYERVDRWLSERLNRGMIEEVKNLLAKKISPKWLDNLGLEYRWITRFLLKEISYDVAIERLKGDTHSFIRHQKTWFNKFPRIYLFDIAKASWRSKLEKTVKDWYNVAQ